MKNSGLQILGKHLGEFPADAAADRPEQPPPAPRPAPRRQPQPTRRDPFLPSPPRSLAEAAELRRQIGRTIEEIDGQLADRARRAEMTAAEYMDWRDRANKARYVKRMQLREVDAWIAAHIPEPESEAVALVRDLRDALVRLTQNGAWLAPDEHEALDRATAYLERLAE